MTPRILVYKSDGKTKKFFAEISEKSPVRVFGNSIPLLSEQIRKNVSDTGYTLETDPNRRLRHFSDIPGVKFVPISRDEELQLRSSLRGSK